MVLAYCCKECGRFTILGYENEFDEHFCSLDCYKKYCENNGYDYNPEHIHENNEALMK